MQLTSKQRKIVWASIIVLVAVYYAPTIVTTAQNAAFIRSEKARAKQQAAASGYHAPPVTAVIPAKPSFTINGIAPTDTAAVEQFSKLVGKWSGGAILTDRGACRVTLELHFSHEIKGDYTGFATIACGTALALMSHPTGGPDLARQAMNAMVPTDLIMGGSVVDSTIRLKVKARIGFSPGCGITEMHVTPFGVDQVATEWNGIVPTTGGPCAAESVVLQRAGK